MRRRCRAAVMVIGMSALLSASAQADPIALTSGVLDVLINPGGIAGGSVRLAGDRGFTFVGSMVGSFEPPVGNPLPPGTPLSLNGGANGLDVGGTVTLDGLTYAGIGGLDSPFGATIRILTAAATLPSALDAPSQITAAFTLDFLFQGPNVNHVLSGSGTATISLDEDRGFGVPSWRVTRLRAEVSSPPAPTPEPGTLLLMAPGLVWAALRRRRVIP